MARGDPSEGSKLQHNTIKNNFDLYRGCGKISRRNQLNFILTKGAHPEEKITGVKYQFAQAVYVFNKTCIRGLHIKAKLETEILK